VSQKVALFFLLSSGRTASSAHLGYVWVNTTISSKKQTLIAPAKAAHTVTGGSPNKKGGEIAKKWP